MARSKNVVGAIYLKHRDLPDISGDITCIICTAVNNVAPDSAVAAQKLRGVWLVYVTDDESRLALLSQGVTINEVKITLHDNNPYVMNQRGTPTERIVIKDFPLLEVSDDIRQFMATEFVQLVPYSDILFSRARNEDGSLTNFANGDRYMYVKAGFTPSLPKQVTIGGHNCRLWHSRQKVFCLRCRGSTHGTNETEKCDAYTDRQSNVVPFKKPQNVLTNYYRCDVIMKSQTFRSSEHAYMWHYCSELFEPELAERVFKAETPAEAKRIAHEMPKKDHSEWNDKKISVMRDVLSAKAASCDKFKDVLIKSNDKILVEATSDEFCGAGLSPHLVLTTKPEMFPGKNELGKLLMELRLKLNSEIIRNDVQDNPPTDAQPTTMDSSTDTAAVIDSSAKPPLRMDTPTHKENVVNGHSTESSKLRDHVKKLKNQQVQLLKFNSKRGRSSRKMKYSADQWLSQDCIKEKALIRFTT